MTDQWLLIAGLAIGTFSIRFGGYLLGSKLPTTGAWATAFTVLPGCLLSALLAVIIVQGSSVEWIAAGIAFGVAILSRNLVLTMAIGILSVWLLRHYFQV
jgi:uncharacterized membrane protein